MRRFCVLLALLLAACAGPQTRAVLESLGNRPVHVELNQVPFFPQTEHQCGPAALATVLNHSGIAITPEALTPEVYLPGREGSLAVEMIAATRRHDRIAWRIPPNLSAALGEVARGNPVLFLQNRSLGISPIWHYAVLVGYDLNQREVVLRSGTMEREIMTMDTFEHTWARGDYWAVIVGKPDELPDFVHIADAMQQAMALEKIGRISSAQQMYTQIVVRWPDHGPAWFGLANTAYALGDGARAEAGWRQLLGMSPPLLPAFYNLAQYLLEQGRPVEALAIVRDALGRWPSDSRLLALEQTLKSLQP